MVFKEGEGQHPHGGYPVSLGIKARPAPGVNVRDSETVTCIQHIMLFSVPQLDIRMCVSLANNLHGLVGCTCSS